MAASLLHIPGDIVNGRYRIIENIGHGATGEVFVAHDALHSSRKLAMKYLKFAPERKTALEQFKSEFTTLTHLSHPHIAKVYDLEQDISNDQFFFTSELIEGVEFLKAAQDMGIDEIEDLFVQSLRALEYLHGNGIFHFDIKSANILVQGNRVKLIDFGLATVRFGGQLVGTPSYMAPEMVRKESPDGRADLYSLGVLIYTALTGKNPFRTQDIQITMQNQLKMRPPRPSENNSDVPPHLDTVVMRLLEKKAEERYQTAAEAIRDLSLRSPRKYSIETEETRDSYIPLESRFIGRTDELDVVKGLLKGKRSGVIVVRGGSGSGKTRFLNEVKHLAQIEEWTTVFLSDSPGTEDWLEKVKEIRPRPTLIGIDDYNIIAGEPWAAQLEKIAENITKRLTIRPTIMMIATDEKTRLFDNIPQRDLFEIILGNFTVDEVKSYLSAVTGLQSPPQNIIDQIYANTGGNPYIVSEVVRSLVTEGRIIDATGRWKESTFEDIKIDVAKLQVTIGLEERLYRDFEGLPEEAKTLAMMMAVIAKPVTVSNASAIYDGQNLKGALLMLQRRGIVKFNMSEGTYSFTRPITGGIIYRRMPPDIRALCHDRAIAFPGLTHDEQLYHTGRGSNADRARTAMDELISRQIKALMNHEAIQNVLYYLERWNDPAMKLNLAKLYNRTGRYEQAISTASSVIAENISLKVPALELIGIAYLRNMQYGPALENFEKALGSPEGLAPYQRLRLQNFIAEVEFFKGKTDKAISAYERTQAEADSLPLEEQLKIRNNNLGQCYFQKGEFQKAIDRLEKDLELHKDTEDRRFIGRTKYILAESYRRNKQFGKAVTTFCELVEYSRSVNDLDHLFRAYNGLGNLYNDTKEFEKALEYYERALDISSRLGLDDQSIACIANLGIISSDTGNNRKAMEYFSMALAFLESGKAAGGIMEEYHCRMHLELGELHRTFGDYEKAAKHLDEAAQIASASSNRELLFWTRYTQARVAKDSGDKPAMKLAIIEAEKLANTEEKISKLNELGRPALA